MSGAFQRRGYLHLFVREEQGVEVVDQYQSVRGPRHSGDEPGSRHDFVGGKDAGRRRLDDPFGTVHNQGKGEPAGARDDELVAQGDGALGEPEASPQIYDGNDLSVQVQDAHYHVRGLGELGEGRRPDHPFYVVQTQRVTLVVKGEDEQLNRVDRSSPISGVYAAL